MKKTSELNIREIEKKINYTFKDKSLLIQAFTRTSYCNEINLASKVKYHSNEVLEFFGDGVLSLSIISFLLKECTERYEHGIKTELGEGDFSNIKSKLSDKQNLSKSMKSLSLEKYLLMGEGDAKLGIQNEPSVMEDLFESIVGAIFIDSDMNINAVIGAVSSMLDMTVYTKKEKISQSAKNALQEWCADKKRRLPAPRYETLSEDGPDHKKTYMRACYIGDKLMGRGIGKNFKLADAAAAEDALKALMAQNEQKMQPKVVKTESKPQTETNPSQKTENANVAKTAQKETALEIEAKSAPTPKATASPTLLLKHHALSSKNPSPTFKDLGERKIGTKTECAVECSYLSNSTLGVGATRLEARENASKLMAELIGIGKKKAATKKVSTYKTAGAKDDRKTAPKKSAATKSAPKNPGQNPAQHTINRKNGPGKKKTVSGKK